MSQRWLNAIDSLVKPLQGKHDSLEKVAAIEIFLELGCLSGSPGPLLPGSGVIGRTCEFDSGFVPTSVLGVSSVPGGPVIELPV